MKTHSCSSCITRAILRPLSFTEWSLHLHPSVTTQYYMIPPHHMPLKNESLITKHPTTLLYQQYIAESIINVHHLLHFPLSPCIRLGTGQGTFLFYGYQYTIGKEGKTTIQWHLPYTTPLIKGHLLLRETVTGIQKCPQKGGTTVHVPYST